jgi:hypothetical protein
MDGHCERNPATHGVQGVAKQSQGNKESRIETIGHSLIAQFVNSPITKSIFLPSNNIRNLY